MYKVVYSMPKGLYERAFDKVRDAFDFLDSFTVSMKPVRLSIVLPSKKEIIMDEFHD